MAMENNNQGGGIPDEARQRLNKIGDTEVNNLFDNGITVNKAILRGMERCAHEGYSLASEEISRLKIALKDVTKAFKSNVVYEKHEFSPAYLELLKEISRLKEENERLRRALSELYDVVFKGENVFKSLDKAHEVLNKPNITIVQSKNK